MPPPSQPPLPTAHLQKTAALPDVIFTAFSFLFLFSTSPKSSPLFFLPGNNNKFSFPLSLRKFPKMSISTGPSNPRSRGRGRLPPPFATPQSLSDWLKPRLSADLFGSWGVKPGTKNIHNLWLEIVEGESFLADSLPPVRTVEVVIVRIVGNDEKVLIESHQELSNGAVRQRCRPLSEKMKPDESVEAAVFRAVKEELGSAMTIGAPENGGTDLTEIQKKVKILPGSYLKKVEERASASYPGLPACYVLHTVDAEVEGLPESEFCTEEVDEYGASDDKCLADCAVSCKKHYWKWVDINSA